jgi:RNA recognition motif-containing protein
MFPKCQRNISINLLEKEKKMNIYVGNLSRDVSEDDLRQLFETFGQVESVNIVKDKFSGESRGFGFVEMPSRDEARNAIKNASGQDLKGRSINVDEARPRPMDHRKGKRSSPGGGRKGGPNQGRGRYRY